MGRMMYVSSEIMKDVTRMKEARRKGLCYDIICYDSKEDNEKEEEMFPHTPLREEEKEKEEVDDNDDKKKTKKVSFFTPSFEMVERYHQELNITDFTAQEFYDFYETNGWVLKENRKIRDWMALMRGWARRVERIKKQNNNDTRRKTADDGEEADWRALGAWLDAHYPVSAETIAAANEAIKKPDLTLKWWGYRIGTTATTRVVIKKLYRLGEALNTSRKGLKAEKLERIAREILWQAPEHTMQDLDHFFTRCKHGHYGNFPKGLQMTDIMRAWRKSEEVKN